MTEGRASNFPSTSLSLVLVAAANPDSRAFFATSWTVRRNAADRERGRLRAFLRAAIAPDAVEQKTPGSLFEGRASLRGEIAATVSAPEEINEEIRYLLSALRI